MFLKILNKAEEHFISLLLIGMTLLVFSEVILRFGFNTGIRWSQEVTLYMMTWFVLFGASYGVKIGAHIAIDSFVRLFPQKIRRIIGAISMIICMAYCVIFMIGAWHYLAKLQLISLEMEDLDIQRWLSESILFLGFLLLLFRFSQLFINILKGQSERVLTLDESKAPLELAKKIQQKHGER